MKTLVRISSIGIVLLALASIPVLAQKEKGTVSVQKNAIIIRPGTTLSPSDEKALNDILKNYDKALYKIRTYKKGKVVKTQGELKDVFIDSKVMSDLAKAKDEGVSDKTIQFVWR